MKDKIAVARATDLKDMAHLFVSACIDVPPQTSDSHTRKHYAYVCDATQVSRNDDNVISAQGTKP